VSDGADRARLLADFRAREGTARAKRDEPATEAVSTTVVLVVGASALLVGIGAGVAIWRAAGVAKPAEATSKRSDTVAPKAQPAAVVSFGPVNRSQWKIQDPPGLPIHEVTCTGDGHPSCGQIADAWKDAQGRRIPNMRKALKLPPGRLLLRAFSAGGHIVRRLAEHPEDRRDIAGVLLADGTYTTAWADQKRGIAAPIESLVALARDAAAGELLFVSTASATPNPSVEHPGTIYPSGAQTQRAIVAELAKDLSATHPELPGLSAQVSLFGAPEAGAWFLDFGSAYAHGEHVSRLAQPVWAALVEPVFGGRGAA